MAVDVWAELAGWADGGRALAVAGVSPGSRPSGAAASGWAGVAESQRALAEKSGVVRNSMTERGKWGGEWKGGSCGKA